MPDLTYDTSAVAVVKEDPLCEGAVMFHGWLAPVDGAAVKAAEAAAQDAATKAAEEAANDEGLEGDAAAAAVAAALAAAVPADELKVSGTTKLVRLYVDPQFLDSLLIKPTDIISKTPDHQGGSIVLVKREARIRRCQDGRAFWFKRLLDETENDPTARHPRPPL